MIALITGGSGCGKSSYAERLVQTLPEKKRYYIATMRVYDAESGRRVARHRLQRAGMGFETVERPIDLASAHIRPGSTVLLEDLPNLLANELFDTGGDVRRILPALERLAKISGHLVIVTNDVFSDGAQYGPDTCEYIRQLAALNAFAAEMADYLAEAVYSIPVVLKGEAPCI